MNDLQFKLNAERKQNGQSFADISEAARLAAESRPDCFVVVVCKEQIAQQIATVEAALAAGADLPLAGLTFCVKDNLDVAGFATTGNCPSFGEIAKETAPAVQLAIAAGAILIGKNTMDQFATGLNGTRAPEPICRNAINSDIIPGGSSSGSAVAVAADICDFSLGSDTGGSGRVPAAANGIVGLKPTPGIISARGMLYCNRSFDVVPIFAKTVQDAACVFDVLCKADPLDPFAFQGRVLPAPGALEMTGAQYAIPADLNHFGDEAAKHAHQTNLRALEQAGATLIEVDFAPFAETGDLVFKSALVAERLVDYGDFIADAPGTVVPAVAQAINAGREYSARDLYEVLHRLAELKLQCHAVLDKVDALVVPTIARLFTVQEMLNDPMALNTIMGTYTYFANPLGLAAIAVPGVRRADGLSSSVCFVSKGGTDLALLEHAHVFAKRLE
jgi:allophanate hydrolase